MGGSGSSYYNTINAGSAAENGTAPSTTDAADTIADAPGKVSAGSAAPVDKASSISGNSVEVSTQSSGGKTGIFSYLAVGGGLCAVIAAVLVIVHARKKARELEEAERKSSVVFLSAITPQNTTIL